MNTVQLPSRLQITDPAYTFGGMLAKVIGVRFVHQTVRYDLELSLVKEESGELIKTRIYNVESKFVSSDSKDLEGYRNPVPMGNLNPAS